MAEDVALRALARAQGLSDEEYEEVGKILQRAPNPTEISIYSAMWSEHCSYKNSILWLKTLPKKGAAILAEAGDENAGLVDLGNGMACVFKIESHNHPSAIEPYQGAATGVGGINRDIFTMGARPVAQLNSLRFGELSHDRNRWLMQRVVEGIGDYGNAFGIPTVGGEVFFDNSFTANPLVNAMSVGIVNKGATVSAIAYGAGNGVYLVGSATGKDGIHGASFASKDLSEDSQNDLPSVQVGDPFQEKLLLEASLEAVATGALIGMQDMGAAGIICSTAEMAAKGQHGMDIYLDKVQLRSAGMMPHEILLSESQERMLLVVKSGREADIEKVYGKWDLNCTRIGEVTEGGLLRFMHGGSLAAEVPAVSLVLGGGAPIYTRSYKEPAYFQQYGKFNMEEVPTPNLKEAALHLVAHPNIASKAWVTRQYDSTVGTVTLTERQPSDASVVDLRGSNGALALTIDCNSRYVHADPRKGTEIAVAEAARNIVCSGGKPLAITNCLNFGNPYDEEVYWQFVQAVSGMSSACLAFETPVTGGNVSFYNQSADGGAVFPTPAIGMLGFIEDKKRFTTLDFKAAGDCIFLLGRSLNDIASSQYLYSFHGIKESPAPHYDVQEELKLHRFISELTGLELCASIHDVSDGGLFICLVESALNRELGFTIATPATIRKDAFLFGEAQGRAVVSFSPSKEVQFLTLAEQFSQLVYRLGSVSASVMTVDDEEFGSGKEMKKISESILPSFFNADE